MMAMTEYEFDQEWQWMLDRWPTMRLLDDSTYQAFWEDVSRFPATTVRRAIRAYHETGHDFAPTSSQIVRRCREIENYNVRYPADNALPGGRYSTAESIELFRRSHAGRRPSEHLRRIASLLESGLTPEQAERRLAELDAADGASDQVSTSA